METQLARSSSDKMLGGVCGGLGRYMGIDSTLVRLFFAFGVLFFGFSPLVYILLWIFMPLDTTLPPITANPPVLPVTQQDPTGEWRYDPYTGEQIRRNTIN